MRAARTIALVGIGLTGWMVAAEIAAAQTLAPNAWAWGNSTRRSVTTTRTVTRGGGGYGGAVSAGVGAANLAVGVIGAAAAAMPRTSNVPVPAGPPPASCRARHSGTWMITVRATGQSYPAVFMPNGVVNVTCPLCPPTSRWSCSGNTSFVATPSGTVISALSADGRSTSSDCCTAVRVSGGQTQVASASGASRPGRASDAAGIGGVIGANQGSDLVERYAGGNNGSCSDITGTRGGGSRRACNPGVSRSAIGQRGANRAGQAMATAERALQTRGERQRQTLLRQAQRAFVQAAQELNTGGDADGARAAIQNAHALDRALSEPEATVRLSNGREYRVANSSPPPVVLREGQPNEYRVTGTGPRDGPSLRERTRCAFIERDFGRDSDEARQCRARLEAQSNVCTLGATCNATSCGTHLAVVQNHVPRMSENWVRQQMRRVGCAQYYRPRGA
jgi:hypothetical protein